MRLLPRRPAPRGPHRPDRSPRPDADLADPAEHLPTGCGWFDSSHALQVGLCVTEHEDADAVVNLVPLSWWLAWELDAAMRTAAVPR